MYKFKFQSMLIAVAAIMTFAAVSCDDDDDSKEPFKVAEKFAKGSGSQADPFVISNAGELAFLAQSTNDGTCGGYAEKYFILTSDIDLDGIDWTPIGSYVFDENYEPDYSRIFMGYFDGQNHTVSNLKYSSSDLFVGAGLFGVVAGSLNNIICKNFEINVTTAEGQAFGALAGYCMGFADNCHAINAVVSGNACIGGLIGGSNICSITNSSSTNASITILGDNDFSAGLIQCDIAQCGGLLVGGAFGGAEGNSIFSDCKVSGKIEAYGNEPVGLGGITGSMMMIDVVKNCTVDVTIKTTKGGHAIGGLCGYAGTMSDPTPVYEVEGVTCTKYPAEFSDCNVTVTIDAPNATHVGGLVGTPLYYYNQETAFNLTNCTVAGTINNTVTPGAIIGRANEGKITSCKASVKVDGKAFDTEVGTTTTAYMSGDQGE